MGRRMSKENALREFIDEYYDEAVNSANLYEFEEKFKQYVIDNDITIMSFGNNYIYNSIQGGSEYTAEIFHKNPDLLNLFNFKVPTKKELQDAHKKGKLYTDDLIGGVRNNWDYDDYDYDEDYDNTPIGGTTNTIDDNPQNTRYDRRRGTYNDGSLLTRILSNPLIVIAAILAICTSLFHMFGGSVYEFLMNGPLFKIFLFVIAVSFILKLLSSVNFSLSGLINSPVVIIAIVLIICIFLYKTFGPAVYSFLMSGILFKLICLIIAVPVTIKILTSRNMGWPIGVKLVVLFAIWVVLKDQLF